MKKINTGHFSLRLLAAHLCQWLHRLVEKMAEQMDECGWHPMMRYHTPRTDP